MRRSGACAKLSSCAPTSPRRPNVWPSSRRRRSRRAGAVARVALLVLILICGRNATSQTDPLSPKNQPPPAAQDSLSRAAGDALEALSGAPDSRGHPGTPGDSLPAFVFGVDSLPVQGAPLSWGQAWEPGWLLQQRSPAACETLLARPTLQTSSAMLLGEALQRESRVGLLSAGSHGAWDLPYLWGPGIERLSLWSGGVATTGAAVPEALLQTGSLLAQQRLLWLHPDPFLDPLALGRDGLLWGERPEAVDEGVPSAVRLTEGPNGASTEEMTLARRAGAWGLAATYAHSRSEGRPRWVTPRYSGSRFQNLHLELRRAHRWGGFLLRGEDRSGRSLLEEDRKRIWEAHSLTLGWQPRRGRLEQQWDVTRRNDLLRWWGGEVPGRRRSTETLGQLRVALWTGRLRWLGAAAWQQVDLHYREGNRVAWARELTGTGFAIGQFWTHRRFAWQATVGWTDPWWGEAHGRGELLLVQGLGRGWRLQLSAWEGASAPFTPRLEGDRQALLAEEIMLPGQREVVDEPRRRTREVEFRLTAHGRQSHLQAGCFVREIANALGIDPRLAPLLQPGVRDTLDPRALRGTTTLRGAWCEMRVGLLWGAALAGDLHLVLDPSEEELPVLVSPYRGRVVFSLGGRLFQGDLRWEGRLIGILQGAWTTPYESFTHAPELERYDAEIHGSIGRAHLFFAVRNLRNADQRSGTYVDGLWMPLPLRSSEVGVEWHFLD